MKNLYFFLLCSFILLPVQTFAQAPTVPSSNLSTTNVDGNRYRINFTRGNGDKRIIVMKAGSPVMATPVNGTDYLAGAFGEGNQILPGEYVVYKGSSNYATITGLMPSTTYHFKIFEYNGTDFSTEYLTSSFLEGSQATVTNPSVQANDITFSEIFGSKMKVSWVNGNGAGRILIARANSPVDVEPQDLVTYNSNYAGYGNSYYEIGTGNYVLYSGSANNVNITNLSPNMTYHFALYEYNGSSGKVYLKSTSITNPAPGAIASQATNAYPTENATGMNFRSFDGNRFIFDMDYYTANQSGNGEKRMIIAKAGSAVTAVPVDGVEYTASRTFGNGAEIAPGEFVVYNGSGSIYETLLNLQPRTTYHFKVFEYNGSGTETYYLTTVDGNGNPVFTTSQSTLSNPTVQASNLIFSNVEFTKMKASWTNGDGSSRILIARANSPVDIEPQDLVTYNSNYAGYGNSYYEIGTGNYVLYSGTGSSVNITNLDPGTTYHFALFEYTGNYGRLYQTASSPTNPAPGATASQATNGYTSPTENATGMNFRSLDGNRFIFDMDYYTANQSGNGEKRMIIAKAGSAVTAVPVDGVEYTASRTFGNGAEIAPGEFVVYNGSGSIYETLLNLQPRTTYHFKVFEYNGSGTETYYLTTVDGNGDPVFTTSQSTLSNPTVQASNLVFSNVEFTKMKASWTNGDGSSRILIARANSPVDIEPQDLVTYNSNYAGYGNSYYEIGTGNYVLYSGTGSSVNITNLDPGTTYHFALFEYTGNYGRLYQTASSPTNPAPGATASQATNGYTSPTENATGMNFRSLDGNRFIFDMDYYTANQSGNGEKRMIIAKAGSAVTAVPVDGVEYTASRTFGNGAEIAPGEFVVYNGSGSIYETLLNLQPRTTYHFKVFEYNGSGTETYYLTTVDGNGDPVFTTSQSTLSNPTVQTNNIFINSKTTSSFNVNWTNGNGARRILVARAYDPVNAEPQDLVSYNANSAGYGHSSYELGNGNYVLYDGTGISVNVTNLLPGTNYHFALFEYNGNYGKLYLRPGYTFEAETFGDTPTTQVSNATFDNIGASSMLLRFNRGNGSARLVIAREGAAVNVTPTDGTTYTANGEFGQGQNLGSGNFVVYNGTAEEFQLSNLNANTQYHFAYFEYSINENNELYVTPGLNASRSTPGTPTVVARELNYTRSCDGNVVLNWTSGNGKGRLVVVSEAPLSAIPQNTNHYTADFDYGMGDAIGNGYVIYNGSGNTSPINLLQPSSDYYVNIFEYNGTKEDPIFNATPLEGVIGNVTLPNVSCNNIQVFLDENGNASIVPEDIATLPGGDCGTLSATLDISSFDCTNLGANNVTLTLTDENNNSTSCVSIVTVVDQTAPAVITKNITVQLDSNGTATIAEDAVNDGSTDACGPLSFNTDITTFNSSHIGDNTVTLTVTDGSNNSSSATAIVTVTGPGAPINDDLCNAIALTVGASSAGDAYSNIGATFQNNEPTGSCWNGTGTKTVWFSFVAPASGNAIVSTDIAGGTLTDTHIAIYKAPTDCNDLSTLVEVGCDGQGGIIVPNNSIANLTGLIAGNIYYVQVEGYNSLTGTFGIEVMDDDNTDCGIADLPFFDGFENGQVHNQTLACWSQQSISGNEWWIARKEAYHTHTGLWYTALKYNNETWMYRPFNLTAGITYEVELYAKQTFTQSGISLSAAFGSSPNAVDMTNEVFTNVGVLSSTQTKFSGNFTPSVSGIYYLGIHGKNNSNSSWIDMDDISVKQIDGCLTPSDFQLNEVTDVSAEISWTEGGSATQWEVAYGPTGFDPDEAGTLSQIVNGLSNTTITGLSPDSNYSAYVRAICEVNGSSAWSAPITFTTNCNGNPTLTFLGTGEFTNSIVTPTHGTPETTYEFAVVYTNTAGELPPYGFPRVLLDYEGNGRYTDINDRAVVLSPADVNDLDTTDGKVYIGSISQLPSGTNWQAVVQVQANGCTTETEAYNVPQVLVGPDLEIFANDITFDNPNPDVSSPLQINATIHNKSDFPAENFIVHLENQFDFTAVYPDITVDFLDARQSITVTWDIITPSIPSWNPMEVFVDYTNVIIESNELNNRAIRPFTNGDFNLPGAINVQASASPAVTYLPSSETSVTVSGYAYYTDTAIQLQDSTVAGATVTYVNPITGLTHQAHTNSRGYFSFRTRRGNQPGVYTAPLEVTDFTLTGETSITWELIEGPCLPDLIARISPDYSSIIPGQSVSGTITVRNNGCAPVEVETLLEMDQTGGLPIIGNMPVPPLAPGESFSHPFTAEFNAEGTYYITALADAGSVVEEASENNNLGTARIKVNPPLPDITPYGSGRIPSQYLCTAGTSQSFSIRNIGYVSTDYFDNTIDVYFNDTLIHTYVRSVTNIDPGQMASVSIPINYENLGRYKFVLNCDVPDIVVELNENNNSSSYYIDILECRPDLYVSSYCSDLAVNPVDPEFPGTVTYSAEVGNRGNATASGPIEFKFTLSNGEVYPLVYNQDILPGERVTFSTSAPTVSSGGTTLTATVDPNNSIDDTDRNNNSLTKVLCWEFEPVPLCGYDFWNRVYHENESAIPTVGVKVKHLYKASEVKVRFEVKEPGATNWMLVGDTTVQNVDGCQGCPYYAALPSRFVFNESGIYTFRMTTDPDNDYAECNEENNVLIKEVLVQNKPDMRILSQYINPTLLNPEPGEYTFFDISYENIGYSNINDRMDLTLMINNDVLAVVTNLPGLIKDRINTIAVPMPYSSEIEGLHVARAIIDSGHDVNDANRSNNEATRSFVVGAAANLSFNEFVASNDTPEVGETIDIDALIGNDGELDVDAEILFSYISATGDTIPIGTRPISVPVDGGGTPRGLPFGPRGGQNLNNGEAVSIPWTVVEIPVRIVGEIINSTELEFDYTDNFAYTQLNNYTVALTSTFSCGDQNTLGSLTAVAGNGTAPYSYYWDNGYVGEILEAIAGTYSVTVVDANGRRAIATGTIEEDPDCIIADCSISAVSFNVPSSCNPETGIYSTTVVVAYENAPMDGNISVNGIEHLITGSPQTFGVEFNSGPVIFNIYFTENDNCNLTIVTGVTLEECVPDCEGIYGGSALPGASCLDANGDPGILDEDCNCEPDTIPTCTSPELTLATQDVAGNPIDDCIEAGGNYYVLATLTGGSGNSTYTLIANGEGPESIEANESIVLGPFDAGTDVSVTVVGNEDDSCGVVGEIDSPVVCATDCTSPELTLVAQDADGNLITECVEAGENYFVLATLIGGSGNSTYTVTANGGDPESIGTNESIVLGPFVAGTDVSVIVVGNEDDSCGVIGNIDSPAVCETECTSPELTVEAQDADGNPITECIEADSSYYVLATLTGGTGNDSYMITANSGDPINIDSEDSVILGPFVAGTLVSVTVTGNDNPSCGVSGDLDSPEVCSDTPCNELEAFVTTWTISDNSITIPTYPGADYEYTVDWGDGHSDSNVGGNITHTYDSPGTYTVSICGIFPRIYFNNSGDRMKIRSIEHWGTNVWTSMNSAFAGAENLVSNATDTPDLSMVTDMYGMFAFARKFNGDANFGNWNVSNVTNMYGMFGGASVFNYPIGSWNVGNVTDMANMFNGATKFNQNLNSWNVGNVISMNRMFNTASMFNGVIGDWNVSNVIDMEGMFAYARKFNQSIGDWNVESVTSMRGMFGGASVFNQYIGDWNVANVTNMAQMFNGATLFNQDLGAWDVGNVVNMERMFRTAMRFNQDIGSWNVGSVTDMSYMFFHANRFDQDLGGWDVGQVNDMRGMFKNVTLSRDNYDSLLNGWSSLPTLKQGVAFDGGNSKYCAGEPGRIILTSSPNNWIINDGGKDCSIPFNGDRVGDGDNASLFAVSLHPNPMKNELVLENPDQYSLESISIFDLTGRLVQKVELNNITIRTVIDVSRLSSATYLVLVTGEDGMISELMIKE
ncbi:BspA family leucine-rich repeat surface protein [Aequorivita sp. H23M31]|uniref:BspA family leucine-rich repeat surface protein n=1 Tax=Aequorivita ciconiae TaxID=2494375 RepID=A0A410G6T9_9FLAO|nr:BspA family leucine-rich repeat surface protein [Aequorivita sp. H23M31]QAA83004.1 BspA family leucine-rich repeat surface protein [Aequorivita sp. H23M31]